MKDIIDFPVVGTNLSDAAALEILKEGDVLALEPQTDNSYDSDAIMVTAGGRFLGYVPNKGYSCTNCISYVDTSDGYCRKCQYPSEYFIKGGLATRLRLSNALNKPHVCYVKAVDKENKYSAILAKLILE